MALDARAQIRAARAAAPQFLRVVAYGGLQNLTLPQAFTAAGEPARSSVSIAWNLSFDAGTGLGAFAAGPSRPRPPIRSRSAF